MNPALRCGHGHNVLGSALPEQEVILPSVTVLLLGRPFGIGDHRPARESPSVPNAEVALGVDRLAVRNGVTVVVVSPDATRWAWRSRTLLEPRRLLQVDLDVVPHARDKPQHAPGVAVPSF